LFLSNNIRVVQIDGEPWFLARDVSMLLFGRTTGIYALTALNDDEKQLLRKQSTTDTLSPLFHSKAHTVSLISESGLYKLIMRSDKHEARRIVAYLDEHGEPLF
jgi:prophage antirepressor-like protein